MAAGPAQILPSEDEARCRAIGTAREEIHDRERSQRLATSGLADDAKGAAVLDAEADPLYGVERARPGGDLDAEIFDFEQHDPALVSGRRRGHVAHAVADEIDRKHEAEQQHAWKGDQPRVEQ